MPHISASNRWYHEGMTLSETVCVSIHKHSFPNKHLFHHSLSLCGIHFYTADRPGLCHWPLVSWFGFNTLIAEAWLQSLARNWNLLQAATGQGHQRSGLFRCLCVEFRKSFIISISLTNIWPLSFLLLYIFTFHFQWFHMRKLITKKFSTTTVWT